MTDVKISKKFLTKVANRISERMETARGQDLKRLVHERNFVYAQFAKHNKHKKRLEIPTNSPDRLVGKHIYSGLPSQN